MKGKLDDKNGHESTTFLFFNKDEYKYACKLWFDGEFQRFHRNEYKILTRINLINTQRLHKNAIYIHRDII